MKHSFIALPAVLLCISISAVAQEQGSFTTYYGREIHPGDTLWVGKPEYNLSVLFKDPEGGVWSPFKEVDLTPYFLQPLVVMECPKDSVIRNPYEFPITAIVSATDGQTFYVNVDKAVYENALQMYGTYDVSDRTHYLELDDYYKLLYYIYTEQTPVSDDVVLRYMTAVNPELGETCKHDKFAFRREKGAYLERLNEELAGFPELINNKVFYYKKKLYHDETWDPEIGGYRLTALDDCESGFMQGYNELDLNLLYQPCETILKMPESQAEAYEKKLKGKGTVLQRYEYAVVYIQLVPVSNTGYRDGEHVNAVMLAGELFNDPSGQANYLGKIYFDPHHYDKVLKK